MNKRFIAAFVIVLALAGNVFALTWKEALALAGKNNSELKSSVKDLESSEWSYRKAHSGFLPQLSASASMTNSGSTSYSYGLSATQYLFRGMDGVHGVELAYNDLEYKKANLEAARASVFYDARAAFINLYFARENIKLLEKILEQRKENSRLIQLRYESGKEDKGNLMGTRADQAQAEYDLASARRELKLAKLKLSQILLEDVESAEEKIELKVREIEDLGALLESSPAYKIAECQMKSAEIEYKKTISGFLPSVSLNGNYSKRGSEWPPQTESNSVSLNISYSFFPGGSNIADRIIYGIRLEKVREDHANTLRELRYSLEDAYESCNDSVEALKVGEISLLAAEEKARIARSKYLNGLMVYDEWDRLENAYIQAQKSILSRKLSALASEALLYKSYGGWIQ